MSVSKGSSSATPIILLLVGLLIGGGGGYLVVSNMYQPKITQYENQITDYSEELSSLANSIDILESDKSNLETQITTLTAEKSTLQSKNSQLESDLNQAEGKITTYESEIISLESQISSLESQISSLQTTSSQKSSQINSLQAEINDLEFELYSISEITVTQHYNWEYGSGYYTSEWTWDLPISLGTYIEYYFRDRPSEWRDWVEMAKDPDDDYYITSMVQRINEAAYNEGFSESEKVNFVISFVQNLPYTEDSETTDWDEYPRYPMETLFDRGGDCEDTSILVATLLDRLGYEVCLIIPVDKNHCAVGVSIEGVYGLYYDYEGTKYYYLETTGEGWEIGDIPSEYEGVSAYIFPLNP